MKENAHPSLPSPGGAIHFGAALVMVCAFSLSFPVWRELARLLGTGADWVPVAALACVALAAAGWARRRKNRGVPVTWLPLAVGGALAVAGLAMTDPAFPAKRIHVSLYMVLALVLRAGP